jgi:hypothetical protein
MWSEAISPYSLTTLQADIQTLQVFIRPKEQPEYNASYQQDTFTL